MCTVHVYVHVHRTFSMLSKCGCMHMIANSRVTLIPIIAHHAAML